MLKKEPALIIAILAALVQAAVMWFTNDPTADTAWALPILTVIGGILTRGQVFSEQTVRDAGLTPSELVARAESPTVPTARGK